MEKTEVYPLLVRGTPIYREVSFHTQTSPYTRTLPAALLYNKAIFLIMEERGDQGRSVRRGEETEKRLLPIQVRTASFFLLNGNGRDLF